MSSPSDDARELGRRLLDAGSHAKAIEQALVRRGMDPDAASKIVEEAIASHLLRSTAPVSAGQPFSWLQMGIGVVVTTAGCFLIYAGVNNLGAEFLAHFGASRGVTLGVSVGGGAGLAIAGLTLARSQLMKLLGD